MAALGFALSGPGIRASKPGGWSSPEGILLREERLGSGLKDKKEFGKNLISILSKTDRAVLLRGSEYTRGNPGCRMRGWVGCQRRTCWRYRLRPDLLWISVSLDFVLRECESVRIISRRETLTTSVS